MNERVTAEEAKHAQEVLIPAAIAEDLDNLRGEIHRAATEQFSKPVLEGFVDGLKQLRESAAK